MQALDPKLSLSIFQYRSSGLTALYIDPITALLSTTAPKIPPFPRPCVDILVCKGVLQQV